MLGVLKLNVTDFCIGNLILGLTAETFIAQKLGVNFC